LQFLRSYVAVSGISSGYFLTKKLSKCTPQNLFFLMVISLLGYEHRLENEHLNNVGKFRAFKSVPLPFNYDEEEDRDS